MTNNYEIAQNYIGCITAYISTLHAEHLQSQIALHHRGTHRQGGQWEEGGEEEYGHVAVDTRLQHFGAHLRFCGLNKVVGCGESVPTDCTISPRKSELGKHWCGHRFFSSTIATTDGISIKGEWILRGDVRRAGGLALSRLDPLVGMGVEVAEDWGNVRGGYWAKNAYKSWF